MVDYNGLENRRAERHRGFESLSLRKERVTQVALSCVMREVDENLRVRHRVALSQKESLSLRKENLANSWVQEICKVFSI